MTKRVPGAPRRELQQSLRGPEAAINPSAAVPWKVQDVAQHRASRMGEHLKASKGIGWDARGLAAARVTG